MILYRYGILKVKYRSRDYSGDCGMKVEERMFKR